MISHQAFDICNSDRRTVGARIRTANIAIYLQLCAAFYCEHRAGTHMKLAVVGELPRGEFGLILLVILSLLKLFVVCTFCSWTRCYLPEDTSTWLPSQRMTPEVCSVDLKLRDVRWPQWVVSVWTHRLCFAVIADLSWCACRNHRRS